VFLWLIPKLIVTAEKSIFKTEFEAFSLLGWALFILFSLLGLWSGYTMSWHGKGTPLPLDCPQMDTLEHVDPLKQNEFHV
jgi:hypothetical protein